MFLFMLKIENKYACNLNFASTTISNEFKSNLLSCCNNLSFCFATKSTKITIEKFIFIVHINKLDVRSVCFNSISASSGAL